MNSIDICKSKIPSTQLRAGGNVCPPTFTTGHTVPWPAAPLGWAQIVELRRTKVRLCYRCRNGRLRFPIIAARALAERTAAAQDPPLPLFNPIGRGGMGKRKEFGTVGTHGCVPRTRVTHDE